MGTLIKATTKANISQGAGFAVGKFASVSPAGAGFISPKLGYISNGAGFVLRYSTPTVAASGGGANTSSGASSAGTASSQVFATPGGNRSGVDAFTWNFNGSANGCYFDNANAQNPNVKRDFTGVANGSTSGGVSCSVYPTITDTTTGAVYQGDPITVGPLAWQNTIPAYVPFDQPVFTPGAGSVTIPTGAPSVTIYVAGAGGGGGTGAFDIPSGDTFGGNGGGSGGWTSSTIALSAGNWGSAINFNIGAGASEYPGVGGSTTITGGIGAGLTASGGTGGLAGHSGSSPGSTGGSPNGVNGTAGGRNDTGAGGINALGASYGSGADGSLGSANIGANGGILFRWN